jgi:hypothetical protein
MFSFTAPQVQALAAVLALLLAFGTILFARRVQREQTASNAYIKYVELAFHNPEFAAPDWEEIDFDTKSFGPSNNSEERKKKFEQYCWFVSVMMNTATFVFTAAPRRHVLQKLMILQIAYHWKYIDHFKERKMHLVYRYDQHKKQIDKGIRLGKQGVAS